MATSKKKLTKADAIRELWKRGEIDYILHNAQKEIKKALLSNKARISTILCSRRFGKTFVLLTMAVSLCIKKPNAIVKYISPMLKQSKQNLTENMPMLLQDCPQNMRPTWVENKNKYIFPNGSEIQVAGTDNGSHETLRGGRADMCIVDEAGFCDHLDYVIKSILRPTTLTTKGHIYLVSTPSKLYTHDFIQKYVLPNRENIKVYTIYDNPMLTEEDIDELLKDYVDGINDPAFQREYMCKLTPDSESMIIPGFSDKKEAIVKEVKTPPFFDSYTSGDVGFKDLTVYLFAYWDFLKARLVILDELVMNGPSMTTERLAESIKEKEQLRFQDKYGNMSPVYMRVMDNNLIMVNDLNRLHGLSFLPTAKDNKEAQINQVKIMINNEQIVIHPRCKHLIYHIESATWDKNHKEFQRLPDSSDKSIRGGHADALDALIYLVRNIVRSRNPYPKGYNVPSDDDYYVPKKDIDKDGTVVTTIKKMLNIRRS